MPKAKKAKKHGRRALVPVVIIVVLASYVTWTYAQPLLTLTPQAKSLLPSLTSTAVALPWPNYGEAAIGAAGYGVLATNGSQTALPTASTAKVITALAVLRQRPLHEGEQGPIITLTQTDVDSYNKFVAKDGSVVGVGIGEQISEYQALEAMLLPSANNMAETLARWAFGSLDAYNAFANNMAHELGLRSVHITDPSGYDSATVASAHDLTVFGTLAMLNPVFAEIVAQPNATVPIQGTINNYNGMLGHGGNIGIKTGNNDGDNGAFLFASKHSVGTANIVVVGTILGGSSLGTVLRDSEPLSNTAADQFKQTTFVAAGQSVGSYNTPDQGIVNAVATQDLQFLTWSGHSFTTHISLQQLHGATSTTTPIGSIIVTDTTNHVSTTVSATLGKPIQRPSWRWRLTHPF